MERTGEGYATALANLREKGTAGEAPIPLPRERRRAALGAAHGCKYGEYPWDHWAARAKDAGVAENLAQLGRSVMRDADQHAWCRELWERCGWTEESAAGMIAYALRSPAEAKKQWEQLMETDGCDVGRDFRPLTDEEFDASYVVFARAFDPYFPASRIAGEEEDPFVQIPGAPAGVRAPRSQVEKMAAPLGMVEERKLRGIRDASGKLALIEGNGLTPEQLAVVQEGIEEGWSEEEIEVALLSTPGEESSR